MSLKLNKKFFFRIHSWIGIKLSILFFIVCFSGTLATLSHEMDWLFIPEIRAEYKGVYASKNEMVANMERARPNGRLTYWESSREPYLCDIVHFMDGGQRYYIFVNPYTGNVQGEATLTFQRFFRDLHYYLFIPFQIGHFTVLFFGFMLFFSLMTALLFYNQWWRKLFELKTRMGKVVFLRSLHRLIGLWSLPFVLLFSLTGMWYFVERTNIGNIKKIANTSTPILKEPSTDSNELARLSFTIDYDSAIAVAQQEIPHFQIKDILPPPHLKAPVYLTGTNQVPLVRYRANRVYLNPTNFEVLKIQNAESLSTITWLNDIADPLHFGYWGGLLTKIIWFVAGLAISGLVITGIWFSQKRLIQLRKAKKRQRLGIWKYINWGVVAMFTFLMYDTLIKRYDTSFTALMIISISWTGLIFIVWYIFVYRLDISSQ